ncbi:hypothetical protein QJS10_CPB11g00502 [Acorus calamus]|uniref:FHA domain-containing protein n=1 Tax=Acorus calamus TaxID=4465 RepID=A0AAV9DSW8_ACOCL|nr:hypothetical protein QJS10_CPB11g00502 [Acorus calamus]
MALECMDETTPGAAKPSASPATRRAIPSPPSEAVAEIKAVARKICDQPLQNPGPRVWAVLTAMSKLARQRPQGMNMLLSEEEHCIGRTVEDSRFQISALPISARHCRIYKARVADNSESSVFLKDTSTNGTFVNFSKFQKSSPETRLCHGDIISFIANPHDERSYAFVYREVANSVCEDSGPLLKRKSEDIASENKRPKGIGIGAPEGPVSLDDVRSLQRSNTELRKELESHVITIETLRSENRTAILRHENELKEVKESVANSYIDQIKDLHHLVDNKEKKLVEVSTTSAELQHTVKDLNERLNASMQSRRESDEIIDSQKATISELRAQSDEERNQRKGEREKATADLKSAIQKVQIEAQEEIKRQADIYLRQHNEQQEVISKLQESEKESRVLVETLRSKLEDARESLIVSEKKVRQLEAQVKDEQVASVTGRNKAQMLEAELKGLREELENEKQVAREEAWAKASAFELEMAAAYRDLTMEKQRFQGARERIILRETQLRSFYSTTEEISALFARQQEQLKAMQKTLEDEENYENASVGIDMNIPVLEKTHTIGQGEEIQPSRNTLRDDASVASAQKKVRSVTSSTSDGSSATEKHACDIGSQEDNTQNIECTSADKSLRAIETAPVPEAADMDGTERVRETESQAVEVALLHRCSNLAGDTMQIDDETHTQANVDGSCLNSQLEALKTAEDMEMRAIRTADLLASEVPGSWAISTAPSAHGENESPKSMCNIGDDDKGGAAALLCLSEGQAAGSQTNPSGAPTTSLKLSKEQLALSAMMEIVAPDFKGPLRIGGVGDAVEVGSDSDAETEEGNSHSCEDSGEDDDDGDDDGDASVDDTYG